MLDIYARDYIDPNGLIVQSGELLGRRTVDALKSGQTARIHLAGLSGISSSYFNIFLRTVCESLGPEALGRIDVVFVSTLQEQVYNRSFAAVSSSDIPNRP